MPGTSYIPGSYRGLATFSADLLNLSTEYQSRLGIPASELTLLQTPVNNYLAAHAIADHASANNTDRQNRKDAAIIVRAAIREFVNLNLRYNRAMTNGDRQNMGLPIPDSTPTPVPVPTTAPTVKVSHPESAWIEIRFRSLDSENRGKPAGVHGAEVLWGVLDTPPVELSELHHSSFTTRSPLKLNFSMGELGKTLYFAIRWETNRGEKGPWSLIQNTVIS